MMVKVPLIVILSTLLVFALIYILFVKAYVLIVKPNEALPYQLTNKNGMGVLFSNTFYTVSPINDIEISSLKYETENVNIGPKSPSIIEIELTPKPAELVLTSSPATENLSWYIDQELRFIGPVFETTSMPGDINIALSSPYHEPVTLNLNLEAAEKIQKTFTLNAIEGQLMFLSDPIGASVSIDGEILGNTPLVIDKDGGEHSVKVTLEGYQDIAETISITRDDSFPNRSYRMTPLQAKLGIEVSPSGGAIFVNGLPASPPISVDASTTHTIRYEKAGYQTSEQQILLKPAEQKTLKIKLEPEYGDVVFTASKTARVIVDGKTLGETPLQVKLQTLPTKVVFSKAGFRKVTKSFKPVKDKRLKIKADILTEFAARRAEGRPLVANEIGIELTRIQGTDFVMGSKANVPFRNRNEHQIKVGFDRPFLISTKEITESQFSKFKSGQGNSNLPITNISWFEAASFCNWLSKQEGLPVYYNLASGRHNFDSPGYRLPTEAEWEYAASKYKQVTTFKYFWGNKERIPDNQGNFGDKSLSGSQTFVLKDYADSHKGKAPVGSYKSRSKLFDMDGNVSEWVQDVYNVSSPDLSVKYTDYKGPRNGSGYVVKGGSYKTGRSQELRNAYRKQGNEPADDLGFRIARYEELE